MMLTPKAVFVAPTFDLISANRAPVAATDIPIKKKVELSAHRAFELSVNLRLGT
jgi:hypothetical protein